MVKKKNYNNWYHNISMYLKLVETYIPIYKPISISDVEPFDSAKDFGG